MLFKKTSISLFLNIMSEIDKLERQYEAEWEGVVDFCQRAGISTEYYEDEFVLDGEFIIPELCYDHSVNGEVL